MEKFPDEELGEFIKRLKESWGEELLSVILFGSWTRGEAKPGSDMDLLIVREHLPQSRLERFRLWHCVAQEISKTFARMLSVVLLTEEEARAARPFYLDMTEEAVILYDKEGFFLSVLDNLRKTLTKLGAKRVRDAKGYPYWILKETCAFGEAIEL